MTTPTLTEEQLTELENLLARAPKWPDPLEWLEEGGNYKCPVCWGEGYIPSEWVKESKWVQGSTSLSCYGVEVYNVGDDGSILDSYVKSLLLAAPALIAAARAMNDQAKGNA